MPGGTCTFSYLTLLKSRDEALVHTAHHSTSIEGTPLSLEEVADLIEGREMTVVLAEEWAGTSFDPSRQATTKAIPMTGLSLINSLVIQYGQLKAHPI